MKKKLNKKELKQQKEWKQLVLGKSRKKKGAWDTMYGGAEKEEEKKTGKKPKNFWVDTSLWFEK